MKGEFSLRVVRDGKTIEEATERNLIVNTGRLSMALLLGGDGGPRVVERIGFGLGAAGVQPTDAGLTNPYLKGISNVNYGTLADPFVEFIFVLDYSEANGMQITEFGLFDTTDSFLFARRVRQAISKQNEIRLEGSWKITP